MECQECKQRPATLHFTKIINGEKTEVHLCDQCSQEKSEMFMTNNGVNFSINNLLAGLLNLDNAFASPKNHTLSGISDLHCSQCNMSYSQFTRLGMFGCSNCYDSFSKQLEPILKRLHNGNSLHTGKIPKRIGNHISVQRKMQDLKSQMQTCIMQEEFEKAAEIRDELRLLEKRAHTPENGGVSE